MKRLVSLIALLSGLIMILTACGDISLKSSSEDFVGKYYEEVVQELEESGFDNIELKEVEDLTSLSELSDGAVSDVIINNEKSFDSNTKFPEDSNAVVIYHVIPKVKVPISAEQLASEEVEGIISILSEAGFTNIQTEDVYDIDPDESTEPKRELKINEFSVTLPTDEEYPFDSEVSIVIHYPYAKYNTDIIVDFLGNIFFDKYDVEVKIDQKTEATIPHGEDWKNTFRLKEGEHKITFCSTEDASIKGETTLDIQADTEAKYKIICYGDKISVETIYIDSVSELGENEAKISGDKWEFYGKNYKDVEATIRELGFTNVTCTPLYDIIWGITEVESVDYVTIDGSDDYIKGKVFPKDAEVIIPYHMLYEDDPAQQESDENIEDNAEIEQSDNSVNNEDYEKLKSYEGEKCFNVTESIKDYGYTPIYLAANTKEDMTGQIEWEKDEGYSENDWIIATLTDVNSETKEATFIVTSKWMRDNLY